MQVVQDYLKAGFKVRGTVRSPSKGEVLKKLFGDKFSYVIVEDITKPNAFDDATRDVDAIAHVASPFHFTSVNPDDYYLPAVKGTVGILEAAVRTPSVKRVVITSSAVAAWQPHEPGYVWDEKDWNTASGELVAEKGGAVAGSAAIYFASKYLAEKAAWDFVKDKGEQLKFDIVTLCPPWIFGPTLQDGAMNTSLGFFRSKTLDPAAADLSEGDLAPSAGSYADIRDVGQAHVLATTTPDASNQRFLVSAGPFSWQKSLDILNGAGVKANKGYPGAPMVNPIKFDGAKATKILGLQYRSMETTIIDTGRSIIEKYGSLY